MNTARFLFKDVEVPSFFYGTAWKEQDTQRCVEDAVTAGFRGIDTANQRVHYYEEGVGAALKKLMEQGTVKREQLFVQSKFTPRGGQDHRLPYEAEAPVKKQVHQSFKSSLQHLGVDYLDSYLLHGPHSPLAVTETDWEIWQAMEELHKEGLARFIGVSNMNAGQLNELIKNAATPPAFIQNRCFAKKTWDQDIRRMGQQHNIIYQGFSLLTGNQDVLRNPEITRMAQEMDKTIPQIIFRFSLQAGMLPLTGTTDPEHMKQDLEVFDFELTDEQVSTIENVAASH